MTDSNLNQFFDICLKQQVSETHIRTLNKYFSTLKTFGDGLDLLKFILNYCPVDFLCENINWLDFCLVKHSDHLTEKKLYIIEKFIEASLNNHELSKKIASDYLSKILEFCLAEKKNNNELIASFNVLIICMTKYNNWFSNHKVKIEEHILSFLESTETIIKKASHAFLYLQQVGNAGTEGINHKNNFKLSVQKLCSTLHDLFDTFMENRVEMDHIDRPIQEGFSFEVLLYDTRKMLHLTATRILNVIKFLMTMIQKDFLARKEITPIEIINVIRRGIIMHKCISTSHEISSEDYQFCLLLNNIQVQLLHLLRILIIWLHGNAACFSLFISNILINCLKRSQNCKCFSLNCVYHETVYVVLNSWIIINNSGLNSRAQADLITCILKDITPIRNQVTLSIKQGIAKKQGIKRKISQNVLLADKQVTNEVSKNKYDLEKEEIKCQLALETLTTLFSCSLIKVDKKIIEEVYLLTIGIFNKIKTSNPPHPYQSPKSQLKLHKLLVSFYEQDTLKTYPFISLSLNILNISSCDNIQTKLTSEIGLNKLEKLCQPISAPFLTFFSQPSEEQSIDTHMQIIDTDPKIINIQTKTVSTDTQIIGIERQIMETNSHLIGTDIVEMDCVVDLTNYNRSESTAEEINPIKNEIRFVEDQINQNDVTEKVLEQKIILHSNISITENNPNDEKNITNNFSVTKGSDTLEQIGVLNSTEIVINNSGADVKQTNEKQKILKESKVDGLKENDTDINDAEFEELNSFVDDPKE